MTQTLFSRAWGKMIHKKNLKQKINGCTRILKDTSCGTVPFQVNFLYRSLLNAGLGCTVVISTGYSQFFGSESGSRHFAGSGPKFRMRKNFFLSVTVTSSKTLQRTFRKLFKHEISLIFLIRGQFLDQKHCLRYPTVLFRGIFLFFLT
jgi:hypothetical protein